MKKFLAFSLAIMVLFSMASVFMSVGAAGFDANGIASIDLLDFSPERNKWEVKDETTGKIPTGFSSEELVDENGKTQAETGKNGMHYPYAIYLENDGYNKNLDYKWTQNGEVIRLTATDETAGSSPGMAFGLSTLPVYTIGSQANGGAQYVKIRFKNNSPSTKLTIMGTNDSWGAGKIDQRIRATIDVEPNSSEWQTVTIDMIAGTLNTTGTAAWSSHLKALAIFPFGYNKDNEAIVNDKYYMDIDYVVIGSEEYVTGYQSELEKRETSAKEFTFLQEPTKKEFFLGDSIDLSGLQASVKYAENKYDDAVLDGDGVSAIYNFDKPLDEEGNPQDVEFWPTTIELKYGALSLEYEVTVYDIKNIEFDYLNGKTEQEVLAEPYDKLDILSQGHFIPRDTQVKITYTKLKDDGVTYESAYKTMQEVELIGADFKDEVEMSEEGYYEYLVTVNYHGHVLYLPVKLIEIIGLEVTTVEDKAGAIYYGTEVDRSFFNVNCLYSNNKKVALSEITLAESAKLLSYLNVTCDTKLTGGKTTAKLNLFNSAYGIDIKADVELTVQTPTDISVKLDKNKFDVDSVIGPNMFTVKYTYADGTSATVDKEDPNLIFNYDTSIPGENLEGTVKIGGESAKFKFTVEQPEASDIVPLDRGGAKVDLLAPKFPTFWLVTIIVAAVIVFLVALFLVLKYVFKVDFKRKKRVSLDDIF